MTPTHTPAHCGQHSLVAPFCLVVDWVAAPILVVLISVGVDFHQ